MAIILQKDTGAGGSVRIHDDYLPGNEDERRAAALAFELTVSALIRDGQIELYGIAPGEEVKCRLIRREAEFGEICE